MSSRFSIRETPLKGLKLLQRFPVRDARGFFERLFCASDMSAMLAGKSVAQVNHSFTRRSGAVRGLHFQRPPHAETKIIACIRGTVFDVAVDLRQGSPTFLQWHAETLSADNDQMICIPEGFAHGFQTLTEDCELIYFHTAAYEPASEGGLNFADPRISIRWPREVSEHSARDGAFAHLAADFAGVPA